MNADSTTNNTTTESGQGMIEYCLIIVFVAIVGLIVWGIMGEQIVTIFKQAAECASGVLTACTQTN